MTPEYKKLLLEHGQVVSDQIDLYENPDGSRKKYFTDFEKQEKYRLWEEEKRLSKLLKK